MSNNAKKNKVFKLMVGVFVALLIVGYGWTRSGKPAATSDTVTAQQPVAGDDEQLKSLVIRMYKWKDQNLTGGDFEPVGNGKSYTGIDFDKHTLRLEVLKRTGFFSDELLNSYDSIAKAIDSKLKSGELKWEGGDLPPFGNGTNPWCACQDYPSDNPWDSIIVTISSLDSNTASLSWTWGSAEWAENFAYSVKAIKVGDSWKISYLQGFNINTMF